MKTFILALFFISLTCTAQTPTPYLIAIGATRAEVRAHLGNPPMLYSQIFDNFEPFEQEQFLLASHDKTSDVYARPGVNEFRVIVRYASDGSASRLHPQERVVRVDLIPDRHEKYSQLLSRIPEVIALCENGCNVEGSLLGYAATVTVCRKPKTSNELLIMQEAAAGWGDAADGFYQWCAVVYFEGEYMRPKGKEPHLDWAAMPVDRIFVGPSLMPDNEPYPHEMVENLGIWNSK